jgi:anti-sigma regulatory factor (Ser/Thr protein kinase)
MLSFAARERTPIGALMGSSETLSIPGTAEGAARAADAVRAWSDRHRLAADTRDRLLTVLDELLSNVVRHAVPRQPTAIEVTVSCDDGVLEARVADEAAPFNPLALPVPDTTSPLDTRQPGGLGVALVRALSDGVRYERAGNRNEVTVSWRLTHDPRDERPERDS